MKDFFISYNSADKNWAEWIAWQLEDARFSTVIQVWDFRPGSNFVLDMQRAASEAERTVAVLSPNYLASRFTQPEWAAAFAQDPTGENGTLLPVRVQACDLKGLLPQIVYIDLVGLDDAKAKQALLDGVKRDRAKPKTAPSFPSRASTPRPSTSSPRFPVPSIWNIPHPRNPNFTGRDDLLTQMRDALASGKSAALTQTIHGLGGVGKTQLAVEYAYRYAAEYDAVWWIRSEETATLAADYAALSQPLLLPERDQSDQRVIIDAVRNWLRQNQNWLLIFDNAKQPDDLHDFLPPTGGATGHVLITSRNPAWKSIANLFSVKPLARDASIEFLLKRTGNVIASGAKQSPPSNAEIASSQKALLATLAPHASAGVTQDADKLADALGDLPLALEQAGAYIEKTSAPLAMYLHLFKERRQEILKRSQPSPDYPDTVATTWELSFQQAAEQSPAAADLLNLCAFLAPDDIPISLISSIPKGLSVSKFSQPLSSPLADAVKDELKFRDAIAALRRFSLIEATNDALSVHRLVQAVARDRLDADGSKTWAEAALKIVKDAFPSEIQTNVHTWPVCARLLPHALAVTEYAEPLGVGAEATGNLLNQAGLYLQDRAQFADAKRMFERALKIGETTLGPDHPNVASAVNNLGSVLQDLGDLAGAQAAFERALKIDEAAFGPDHPNVASDVNNLGSVLQSFGDLTGAKAHYERALKIDEAAFGPDHPNVAIRFNNLGKLLEEQGDLKGAKAMLARAYKIFRNTLGENYPNTTRVRKNLEPVEKKMRGSWWRNIRPNKKS